MENDLYHFGVKGMKWGIRRDRNKGGSSTSSPKRYNEGAVKGKEYTDYGDGRITIKKGTNLQRLIGPDTKQDIAGATYASFTKYDNNSYIRHIAGKGFLGGGRDTKLTLKATTDLKSPSTEEAGKLFFQLLKDNPKVREDYGNSFLGMRYKDKELDALAKGSNKEKTIEEYKLANSTFGLYSTKSTQDAFYKVVEDKGYNMLRDENDISAGYSKAPVILLDGSKSVTIESRTSVNDEMRKEAKSYVKQYRKHGEEWMKSRGF